MAQHRTKQTKENANYNFLYSWKPTISGVKGELNSNHNFNTNKPNKSKKAEILAQESYSVVIKKDIIKSVIIISFLLTIEIVIYLALNRFNL